MGEGPGAAEGQGGAVVGEGLSGVDFGFGPELQGAELGDSVFDVIEGGVEEMALALPEGFADGFPAGPVDGAAEAIQKGEPVRFALGRACGRGGCRSSAGRNR